MTSQNKLALIGRGTNLGWNVSPHVYEYGRTKVVRNLYNEQPIPVTDRFFLTSNYEHVTNPDSTHKPIMLIIT